MGMEICGDEQHPIVSISSSSSAPTTERYRGLSDEETDLHIRLHDIEQQALVRDGNVWTALAHIITAVIGSGVLSLAWSMSRLGWIAGPLTMLAFASVTLTSALLLRDCYKSPDPDYGPARNASYIEVVRNILGNVWTALAHIITAVIGSGVLSLAWSMSRLGWIAGPLTMLAFASVTLTSALLLRDCYKSPDESGLDRRNASYIEAVRNILGKKNAWVCGIFVRINFIKLGIVYTIASSISMSAIQRSNCYHTEGHEAACKYGNVRYMLTFGIIQTFASQIPDFQNTIWLSIIAAIMSFTYSIIGLALGLAEVIQNGVIKGSIGGVPTATTAGKVWAISEALGDIAFAFPFSVIFLEIQVVLWMKDTLKSTPPENVTMKRASIMAVCITTSFYLLCGGFGYAAFGNSTPGNLLTGFGFYEPYWLINFANVCVALNLVGGYQVFSQALFANVEKWVSNKFPTSTFVHKNYDMKQVPILKLNLLRLCFRTSYVAFTTGSAILIPHFNQVVAVAGTINFWPVVVYFPVEMYLVQKNIGRWTGKFIVLRIYDFVMLLVIMFAFVGSVRSLIKAM